MISNQLKARLRYPVLCQKAFDAQDQSGIQSTNDLQSATYAIHELDRNLELLSRFVYQYWADFFQGVASGLSKFPLSESDDFKIAYKNALVRLFVLNALEPVLEDIQSATVKEDVLPNYRMAKEEWNFKFKVKDLRDLELNSDTYKTSLQMVHLALVASKSFVPVTQQHDLDTLGTEIGKAMGTGLASLADINATLDTQQELLKSISANPRTHGFGVMLEEIALYLKSAR